MAHDGMTTEQWNAQQDARTREAFEARIQREEDAKKARKRHQDTMQALAARPAGHEWIGNLADAEKHLEKTQRSARPAMERAARAHSERESLEKQNVNRAAEITRLKGEIARLQADAVVDGLTPAQDQEFAQVTADLAALESEDAKAADALLAALVTKERKTVRDAYPLICDLRAAQVNVAQLRAILLQREAADAQARLAVAADDLVELQNSHTRLLRNRVEPTQHALDGFRETLTFALREVESSEKPTADSE